MSNKYSIDELFREGLSEGREHLNLGAWANMDRMLNGQNPYMEEEQPTERKKRRWLPLLLIGVLITAIIGAGTFLLNNNKDNKHEVAKTEKKSQDTQSQYSNEVNNTNKSFNIDHPENNKTEVENTYNVNNNKDRYNHNSSEKNKTTKNNENTNETSTLGEDEYLPTNKPETNELIKNKKSKKGISKIKSNTENTNEEKTDLKDAEIELVKNTPEVKNISKLKQTVNTIVTKEHVVKDEYNVNNTKVDTISITQTEREQDNETNIALENKQEIKSKNTNYHPRYIGAHIHVEGRIKESSDKVVSANKLNNENDNKMKAEDSKQNSFAKNEKNKEKESDWKNNLTNSIAKVGEKTGDFFSAFKKLDLGISLGLSVALFGTQNNYGGFQGGITNATRISDNLTLLSELKFFLHNNAGFTINQIQTNVFNQSIDSITYAATNQTLYSYQIDSIVKKYNFKNFMSLQLPVMLQYTFNRFGIYAGANFAYNFKIKTTEADNKYVKSYFAKVNNGTQYEFPTGTATDYARTDFRARYGIGYAVGFNCYINSKVYVDLRLAKQLWDNSNNNAMREISTGVTKVPFTQLSLGYKFGKKD